MLYKLLWYTVGDRTYARRPLWIHNVCQRLFPHRYWLTLERAVYGRNQ